MEAVSKRFPYLENEACSLPSVPIPKTRTRHAILGPKGGKRKPGDECGRVGPRRQAGCLESNGDEGRGGLRQVRGGFCRLRCWNRGEGRGSMTYGGVVYGNGRIRNDATACLSVSRAVRSRQGAGEIVASRKRVSARIACLYKAKAFCSDCGTRARSTGNAQSDPKKCRLARGEKRVWKWVTARNSFGRVCVPTNQNRTTA